MLLRSQAALERAVVRALVRGHDLRDLLIVEYIDTSDDDGLFRKYGAFIVGDRVLPRNMKISENWEVRGYGELPANADEELGYLRGNPHEEELRDIARFARIAAGESMDRARRESR